MSYTRWKTLGGSTTLNFMVYQRGNPKDYQAWVNATGDDQWSYSNVLPWLKKFENYRGNYLNAILVGILPRNSNPNHECISCDFMRQFEFQIVSMGLVALTVSRQS